MDTKAKVAIAVAGGIACAIGYFLWKKTREEETELPPYEPPMSDAPLFPGEEIATEYGYLAEEADMTNMRCEIAEISEESYLHGKWSKRLVATYFPYDKVLAGFDDELEPLSPEKLGLEDIVDALASGHEKAVYAADMNTLIAYEFVVGKCEYAEAKEELEQQKRALAEDKAEELGYSKEDDDPFDSVVASVGD